MSDRFARHHRHEAARRARTAGIALVAASLIAAVWLAADLDELASWNGELAGALGFDDLALVLAAVALPASYLSSRLGAAGSGVLAFAGVFATLEAVAASDPLGAFVAGALLTIGPAAACVALAVAHRRGATHRGRDAVNDPDVRDRQPLGAAGHVRRYGA